MYTVQSFVENGANINLKNKHGVSVTRLLVASRLIFLIRVGVTVLSKALEKMSYIHHSWKCCIHKSFQSVARKHYSEFQATAGPLQTYFYKWALDRSCLITGRDIGLNH